jgi:hypothetical protein
MTKDPRWVGKLIIVGLIGFIPILGQMNLLGWTLASLDNLRAGRAELGAGNFSHIGRGAPLFVVVLLYGLLIGVIAAVFYVPGIALTVASQNGGGSAAVGSLLTAFGGLVVFVASLGLAWIQPIVYLRTDRHGIGAGLDLPNVIGELRAQPMKTLLAALLMYVGSLIGGIGFFLCLVGAAFTVPFGYAIVAGVLRVYEQQASPAVPQAI